MKITGVDTLEIGINIEEYDRRFIKLLMEINKAKELSQRNMRKQVIEIYGSNFEVSPKGQGFYRYKIENKEISICFAHNKIQNTPPIYVRFSAMFLWEYGYEKAYEVFIEWFKNFNANITNIKISRLDICLDIDEINFNEKDIKNFFSKAQKMEQKYVDDIYHVRKTFSGFTFGKGGNVSCRIYDKTLEIKHSSKAWFEDIWKEACWNENKTVWRIEFQMRGKALKELKIINIEDIKNNLINIWSYLTQKWLVMKKQSKDSNKSRWKVKSKWKVIQMAAFNYKGIPTIREKILKGDKERLIAQCSGLVTSIAALSGKNNINSSFLEITQYLQEKSIKNNTSIEKEIDQKKNRFIQNKSS